MRSDPSVRASTVDSSVERIVASPGRRRYRPVLPAVTDARSLRKGEWDLPIEPVADIAPDLEQAWQLDRTDRGDDVGEIVSASTRRRTDSVLQRPPPRVRRITVIDSGDFTHLDDQKFYL